MARPIDYSVWDHIEISDDEDDTHPNVDTPSLFNWRHQARVERMEQMDKDKETLEKGLTANQRKLLDRKKELKQAEEKAASEELAKLKLEVSDLEKQEGDYRKKEEELKAKEKSTPWNIDTICHDGKSKTIINKEKPAKDEDLTDDQKWERQQKFTEDNEKLIKKYGMLQKYEDSQAYLVDHAHLACEDTANYLVLWCINLEVEEKHDLMHHVSHQCIVMQFILELAKSLKIEPQNCIRAFFSRIQMAEKQYLDAFNDELQSFKQRVESRAKVRLEQAMKEVEEEEREKRLGPGGLDPLDVIETLPNELKECFESKDVEMLQKVLLSMPKEEAEAHMRVCIDSGLWVADAKAAEAGDKAAASSSASASPEYEDLPDK